MGLDQQWEGKKEKGGGVTLSFSANKGHKGLEKGNLISTAGERRGKKGRGKV